MEEAAADVEAVQPSTSWVHVTGNPAQNLTPPDVEHSEQKSPPAKRRKEDRERSRVSRACDRCKKYVYRVPTSKTQMPSESSLVVVVRGLLMTV